MSMLNNTSSGFAISGAISGAFRSCAAWLSRMIHGYIAKVIAHREYQANLYMLRNSTDRELMDMGINRTQIGNGLAEAARDRSALQEFRQRQSMMS